MLSNLFYHYPVWVGGLGLILLFCGLTTLGLFIFHNLILKNHLVLRAHNDIGVGMLQVVATIYAVLLALLVFDVLNSFADAEKITQAEASVVGNLVRDAVGLPADKTKLIHAQLIQYLNQVIYQEWPAQQNDQVQDIKKVGWAILTKVGDEIVTYQANSLSAAVIQSSMFHELNELYNFRRARLLATGESLPSIIWEIILSGGIVFLLYISFLGAESFMLKLVLTNLVVILIMLVVILIIALDRPFQGQLSIKPTEFIIVQNNLKPIS